MGKKHKNAGRGAEMIDRAKKESGREEKGSASEARTSEPSTSGSSYERSERYQSGGSPDRSYPGTSREKLHYSSSHGKLHYSDSREKLHPSSSHERLQHSKSRDKLHQEPQPSTSREKSYASTSYQEPQPSTSREKSYASTSYQEPQPSTSREKSYASTIHHEPQPSTSREKSYASTSHHEPQPSTSREKSYASTSHYQPLPSTSHDRPYIPPFRKSRAEPTDIEAGPSKERSSAEPQGKGRGHFLEQLAKQSKFKASLEAVQIKEYGPSSTEGDQGRPSTFEGSDELGPPVIRRGETGQKVKMHCNYITLTTTPGKGIFEYEVKFAPEIESVRTRFKLVYKYIPVKKGIQCFDGMFKLFLPEADKKQIVVEGETQDHGKVVITANFKRQVRLEECGNFYNVLFNNCAKVLNLTRLGRHHYDSQTYFNIPQHKLEIWPGYVTSVEEFEGGIHLCCDIKHRILRNDTAYDILSNIFRNDPKNFKTKAVKELLGHCVLTRYNNHMYRIDDIAWDETPLSTFKAKGQEITYVDYYKTQYNIDITDLRQPLLVHIPKKNASISKICLIPEICHMTGLTDSMRKDMKVMKEVAAYTRITPAQRESCLKKFVDNINNSTEAQELLNNWGLKICEQPVTLEGRILPAEDVYFKNERTESSQNAEWLRVLRRQGVLRSIDIVHWLVLHSARDKRLAETFVQAIRDVGPSLGIRIHEPLMVGLRDDRIESYIKGLKENVKAKTQIVLCLCGTPREDRYSAIKKLCCLDMNVPSQIVNAGTIARDNRLRIVAQNIALQMNNKLGGASWALSVPLKNCMICGIDTYHDSEKKSNSVGALVASMDARYTQWFSQTCIQEPKQELLHGLIVCFATALQKYHSLNKKLPDRIVIFRDGVSDGHLKVVQEVEIKQFLEACKLAEDYNPKFSYVIVQKRINTKFFLSRGEKLENPGPGSVLDHTITRRNYYDFFLVSQHVSCGTATPSHYIVLYDNSGLKPDYMQRLTYKFCHMYYNWPGTIRVPAPCQYAHKLAFLVGQNLKKEVEGELKNMLFYL